jgi:uncharacterized protein YndB with AHSA1/START domain
MGTIISIAAVIGVPICLILLIAVFLPRKHVAATMCYLEATPQELWRVITDYEAQPVWRPKLTSVERLPDRHGNEVWKECEGPRRCLSFETVEASPPDRLVRRIVDDGLPFGGTWTFEITPEGSGSQLQITENGEVRNLVFRFVSRFVIGHTASMEAYVKNLESALKNSKNVTAYLRSVPTSRDMKDRS